MNHDEATRYFDDLGERVPDLRPPMADLVSAGQSAVRRKGRRTIGLVAAAVALVGVGGAAFQHAAQGDDERLVSEPSAVAPVVPDGMRLVGMGRVVVAVPETWVNFQPVCGEPDSGYVYFLPVMNVSCVVEEDVEGRPGQPSLTIGTVDDIVSAAGEDVSLEPSSMNVGPAMLDSGVVCSDSWPEECQYSFAPHGVDVAFTASFIGKEMPAEVLTLRTSLQLLPDGYTTVPFIEPGTFGADAVKALEDASLTRGDGFDANVPTFGTIPAAGSVVPVHGTVELLTEPVTDQSTPATPEPHPGHFKPCHTLNFEGRRYVLMHRPEGAGPGVGRILGTARATGCAISETTAYSVNEEAPEDAITMSDGEHVWLYTSEPGAGTESLDGMSPVLAAIEMNAYPTAGVSGVLSLQEGCLMLDENVVVWPAGTSWDESSQAVNFSQDFEGEPNAVVGEAWSGGGGYYVPSDAGFLVGGGAAEVLAECVNSTGATEVVFAYPAGAYGG